MSKSGHDASDGMCLNNAGEFVLQAAVEVGEFLVVEAHEVKDGRVEVAEVAAIHNRRLAQFIGFTEAGASVHPRAGEPISEAFRIMIAAAGFTTSVERFRNRHAPKFT